VETSSEPPSSRLRALAELVRLPNVFTAMADVLMGYLFTHDDLSRWGEFALLLAGSCVLYMAGMVLNDYFDRHVDAQERPDRPIPSGRIAPGLARRLGFAMLLAGGALGWTASAVAGDWKCAVVATALAAMVLAYDCVLKQTPLGPLAMGCCRALNVLLGMSAAPGAWHEIHWLVAGGIGTYIVGVTWLARTEARTSSRWQLLAATIVVAGGIGLLAWFPSCDNGDLPPVSRPSFALVKSANWYLLMGVMGWLIGWRCLRAVFDPSPAMVQAAVRHCIFSLVMLDAAACLAVRGPFWAIAILLLLAPTMFLGRWIYST
jgi:4-hydroxybenzoate polyprenyltransferase